MRMRSRGLAYVTAIGLSLSGSRSVPVHDTAARGITIAIIKNFDRIATARSATGRFVGALTGFGLALTMLMSSLGPASAEKAGFTDPADTTGLDIRRVHVNYGDRLYIRVKHDGPLGYNESYRFWIDTRPENPGPEYYVSFSANTEFGPMKRVSGFTDPTKQSVRCSWRPYADVGTNSDVVVRIPGSCLGDPRKVRTSLRFVKPNGSGDWAPRYRAFYDWVRRH